MKEAAFPALSPTSDFSPARPSAPVKQQPQPSPKGRFYFISSGREDSPNGFYAPPTMPSPYLGAPSPLFTILCLTLLPPFSSLCCPTPISQDPKAAPSTVGACAEYQAEGAEPTTCLLQF